MVRYYYNKYYAKAVYGDVYTLNFNRTVSPYYFKRWEQFEVQPTKPTVDSNGNFIKTNSTIVAGQNVSGWVFHPYDSKIVMQIKKLAGGDDTYIYGETDEYVIGSSRQLTGYTRGALVQSNIIAENGTYPANGRHSDGYWYVRGSAYNEPPTTPGAFTSPVAGTVLKGGENIPISWGASSDADGNSLDYRFSYRLYKNGVVQSWTNVASTPTTPNITLSANVTDDVTITGIDFRVRAYDGTTYSSYRYSEIYTVTFNAIPTLTLNTTDNQTITQSQSITIPTETPYQFKITASDEDTDQTLQYKVSVGGVNTIPLTSITADTETLVTIDKSSLVVGMNAVVVTVQDDQGAETTFQFNIIVDANLPIDSSCLANMRFNGYSLSTISLAELVNHLE